MEDLENMVLVTNVIAVVKNNRLINHYTIIADHYLTPKERTPMRKAKSYQAAMKIAENNGWSLI